MIQGPHCRYIVTGLIAKPQAPQGSQMGKGGVNENE